MSGTGTGIGDAPAMRARRGLPRWLRLSLLAVLLATVAGAGGWYELERHHHHWGRMELLAGRYAGSWHVDASDRDRLTLGGWRHEHLRIELDRPLPQAPRRPDAALAIAQFAPGVLPPAGHVTWDGVTCPMAVETLQPFGPLWLRCTPPEGERPFGNGTGSDGFSMDMLVTRGSLDGDVDEDWLFLRLDPRSLASGESLEGASIRFVRD